MKPGETKILNALVNHIEGLSYTELIEQTKVSNTALARYLKILCQIGVVRKDFENRKYVLAKIYLPMENFANEWQKQIKTTTAYFLGFGIKISKIKDRKEKIIMMQAFLRGAFHLLTLYIWKVTSEAILDYGDDIEKIKDQDLAVKKSMIINRAMQNWITGMADAISSAMLMNLDVVDAAGYPVYKEVIKKANQNLQQLEKL